MIAAASNAKTTFIALRAVAEAHPERTALIRVETAEPDEAARMRSYAQLLAGHHEGGERVSPARRRAERLCGVPAAQSG